MSEKKKKKKDSWTNSGMQKKRIPLAINAKSDLPQSCSLEEFQRTLVEKCFHKTHTQTNNTTKKL